MLVRSGMTETQIRKCHERLDRFLVDLLEPVGRSERRHWGAVNVRGLLLDGERKSVEPMASRLPDGNVQAMQQFVGQSPWDWHPIWERLGRRMTAELEPESAWAIDDTGFPKQGDHSVGVERPDGAGSQTEADGVYSHRPQRSYSKTRVRRHARGLPQAA